MKVLSKARKINKYPRIGTQASLKINFSQGLWKPNFSSTYRRRDGLSVGDYSHLWRRKKMTQMDLSILTCQLTRAVPFYLYMHLYRGMLHPHLSGSQWCLRSRQLYPGCSDRTKRANWHNIIILCRITYNLSHYKSQTSITKNLGFSLQIHGKGKVSFNYQSCHSLGFCFVISICDHPSSVRG